MRTVHSYALTMLQTWWPELTRDTPNVTGWEYVMVTSYAMECAKRGFLATSAHRRYEIMKTLDTMYPAAFFGERHAIFHTILNNLGEQRLASIIQKIREEVVSVTGGQNLVWMGLRYSPIDLVRCCYHLNPISSMRTA